MPGIPRRLVHLSLCCTFAMTGCQSNSSTGMTSALREYDNNALSVANLEARKVYDRNDADRWEAAWIMGLCNQRLGQFDAARSNFEIASKSPDQLLRARARAMLGQNMLQAGHAEAAAIQFEHAWPDLSGNDRRKCAQHAVDAWTQAGRDDHASRWKKLASNPDPASPPPYTASTNTVSSEGTFHLQAGAYRDADGAKRAQGELVSLARKAGVQAPVIRTRTDRHGGTLYLVQVGMFQTRNDADVARRSMRNLNLIVVAEH